MLFSRSDRTFQLELVRDGRRLTEQLHVNNALPRVVEHDDEAAAIAAHRERILGLLAEGWTLAWADSDVAWPVACEPAMESAILDARDDRQERLAVYTDWLIERGDPCGELAALRALAERSPAVELEAAIAQLERRHADALFGPYASYRRDDVRLVWSRGWIEAFDFEDSTGTLVTLALHAPMARFTRRLTFRRTPPATVGSAIALAPRRHAIRRLELPARISYAHKLIGALPALDELTLAGGTRTHHGHPTVRALRLVIHEALSSAFPSWLVGAWPALASLRIHIRAEVPALERLLATAELPALVELEVAAGSSRASNDIAAALPSWPLAQLRRLRLSPAPSAFYLRTLVASLPQLEVAA